jgi:hypothetical protein
MKIATIAQKSKKQLTREDHSFINKMSLLWVSK